MPTLLSFATLTWIGVMRPASLSLPRRQASICALVISTAMSASFFWTSWNRPMGPPNCSRSWLYCSAESKHAWAAPIAPQEMP